MSGRSYLRWQLIHRRASLGLSLSEVATLAGITKSHVWNIEQGRSPNISLATAEGLASALGLSLGELLGLGRNRDDECDRLYEALVQADLKIRSFPGTDQSDVEFIRRAIGESAA